MKISDAGFLLLGVALNAGAQLGLKSATTITGPIQETKDSLRFSALQLLVLPSFWFALLAYVFSLLVWVIGLSRVPVSQAYPMLSLGYVLTAGMAWFFFGEAVSVMRLSGIGIIIIGVFLVARSS